MEGTGWGGRGVDVLVIDLDGVGVDVTRLHRLLDSATACGVSVLGVSGEAGGVSLPLTAAVDAVLQKPVRKDTFSRKVQAAVQRRQARVQSTVLAKRAEGYKEMVERIRQRRTTEVAGGHSRAKSTVVPPARKVLERHRSSSDEAVGLPVMTGAWTETRGGGEGAGGEKWKEEVKEQEGEEGRDERGVVALVTPLQRSVQSNLVRLGMGQRSDSIQEEIDSITSD